MQGGYPLPLYAPSSFTIPTESDWCRKPPEWFPDIYASSCFQCNSMFNIFTRRHHCRLCGGVFCDTCCKKKVKIPLYDKLQRVCILCESRVRITSEEGEELTKKSIKTVNSVNNLVQPQNTAASCPINLLTKDLLKEIFKFVKEPYYFRLLFVCRTFREVANADTMWQFIYCRRWNIIYGLGLVWRRVYRKKHIEENSSGPKQVKRMSSYSSNRLVSRSQWISRRTTEKVSRSINMIFLGASGCGKTSIARAIGGINTNNPPKPTIGASLIQPTLTSGNMETKFIIWDFSGNPKYRNLAPLYYSDAQVAILVFDITIEKSLEDCKFWLKELREKGPKGLSFVLLGNKEDYTCEFSEEIKDEFIKSPHIQLYSKISAISEKKVNDVFSGIARLLPIQ